MAIFQSQVAMSSVKKDLMSQKGSLVALYVKPRKRCYLGATLVVLWWCRLYSNAVVSCFNNKPLQDGGEAKAPLWLNRLSGTN